MNEGVMKIFYSIDLEALKGFRREILGALILVSFTFLFYESIYSKNGREIELMGERANGLRAEIEGIKAEINASDALKKRLGEATLNMGLLEASLEDMTGRLPSERHLSELLSELTRYESTGGSKFLSVKPLPLEDKGEFTRVPFHLTMESRFIPFGDYLEQLENLQRVMVVDNFRIDTKGGGSLLLKAQLYLSTFILNN
jgi:Tfp pilus assembly protein PilO